MKKLLALCMLVLLTVALAGCGGGQKKAAYPADGDINECPRPDPVPAEGTAGQQVRAGQ